MDYYDYDQSMDDPGILFEASDSSVEEVWENCISPSLVQFYSYIQVLFFYNFLFRILCTFAHKFNKPLMIHLLSATCGNLALVHIIGQPTIYCVLFIYSNYLVLVFINGWFRKPRRTGYVMALVCIITLTACELYQTNSNVWHKIRGIQMVSTMKIISLAFDLDKKNAGPKSSFPGLFPFLGYLFCPANCILGPWNSFHEYDAIKYGIKWDFKWILWTILNCSLAIVFAISSNCIVPVIVSDYSWKWLIAYRDALSFRCSHYFVSYLSQATMSISGFATVSGSSSSHSKFFGYQVIKPWSIEFPRSLTEVVINWNIPMHNWLKLYVFRIVRRHSVALAIFTTYLVSALLHGMNLQLAIVLLSLGLYTFVEYELRAKIANYLNGCMRADSCSKRVKCEHELKSSAPIVLIANTLFSGFTVIHLAYLGSMFESSTSVQDETHSMHYVLSKWDNLNYSSHWIVLGSYVCYLLL